MTDNIGKFWILGLLVGFGIGSLTGIGVSNYNTKIDQAERRKQMVESGIGRYNARTGEFEFKQCLPDQQTE